MNRALGRSLIALTYPLRLVAHLTAPVEPDGGARVEIVRVSGAARRP